MEIFINRFFQLTWDQQKSTIYHKAFPETVDMTNDDFKEAFNIACDKVEELLPKYYLSDTTEQNVAITPDLQVWVAENVYPRWSKAGLKRLAVVVPKEYISFLSLEQTVDEIVEKTAKPTYEIQYFDNFLQADMWLQSN